MSWVVEEWKEGLPTKTLQKIQELESQLDKLKKERQQRQLQLESLEAAFQKQKQKVESEKGEVSALKRENQSLIELCDSQEKAKQKLTHDHQVKESQVNFLEGQLSASKKHIEKLEQELKRYKNDLEKSQHSFNAGDMSLCVTPQKSFVASFTPNKYSDSRYEELQEKYNKEVEERRRLETELKVLQKVNLPSQPSSQSTMNHRDIARHQSSSSVFSWQESRTPSRHEKGLKRSFASSQCPWEQEETPSKKGFISENPNKSVCDSFNAQLNDQLKAQNQELKSKISEMETRLQLQEKDLKNQLNKFQEIQNLLEKTQAELAEKDKTLAKSRDDLARVTLQFEQTTDKCVLAEQKLKKVSEELSCQRQNAESARITVEQKLKEREKENQQEILRQQNSLKNLEQQMNQMKSKFSQEAQQAKNDFNAIQSELDRTIHAKKVLENEVDELKQNLCSAEQSLHVSQSSENDLKKNLKDSKSEYNTIKSQYEQKSKDILKLEEELKTVNQTLRQNQLFVDEMKSKNMHLEEELKSALEKCQNQDSVSFQNLQVTMTNLEKEKDFAQELLKKRERDIEETKNTLAKILEESEVLKCHLDSKEKECKELINTNISLCNWKKEHEEIASHLSREKEEMLKKISDLENLLQTHNGQVHLLENDKKNLHTQIKTLQEIVDAKTADLETLKGTYTELQQKWQTEEQTFRKETEKLVLKINELEKEIKEQKSSACLDKVCFLENELLKEKELNFELQRQHEELLKNKMEIQQSLTDAEKMHEQFVTDSRSHIESLQNSVSSKQNYVDSAESVIKVKEEEIATLSEKLRHMDTDMQSAHESNNVLNAKLQQLNLLSESWSIEKERLTTLIAANQKEIELLSEENKRINELNKSLNYEKTQLLETNKSLMQEGSDMMVSLSDRNKAESEVLQDGCSIDIREYENLKQELANLKGKQHNLQKDNERLLCENEELTKLVSELRNSELFLNKITEELRVCIENSSNKDHSLLELLQMSLDEKQIYMGSLNDSVKIEGDGDNKIVALNDKTSIKIMDDLPSSDLACEQYCANSDKETSPKNNGGILDNIVELQSVNEMESNGTSNMLDIIDQNDDSQEYCVPFKVPESILHQFSGDSPLKNPASQSQCEPKTGRRSVSGQLCSDLILGKSFEEQLQWFTGIKNEDVCNLKELLTSYQSELNNLRKQHLSEIKAWQQKLKEQAAEMETKLAAEKQQTEMLSQELEAARLELQYLDLSARSILSFDTEDLTKTIEAANQSICSVLPLGKLSLSNTELLKNQTLKEEQIKTNSKNTSESKIDENHVTTDYLEKPDGQDEHITIQNECVKYSPNAAKSKILQAPLDNLKIQSVIENLKLQAQQISNENLKLLQSLEEKEKNNQNLVMEIKDLNVQVDLQQSELVVKENISTELQNKVKELEDEKLQLSQTLELLSNEKLQLSSKAGDLEKELNNLLTVLESLKVEMSDLSGIRESLEISNGEWKEKYLETKNKLSRMKSEKANIENHAISLESDLDELQSKCQILQEENEANLKSVAALQECLDIVLAEKNQMTLELESLTEEKEELEQMYQKLKETEQELESHKIHNQDLIKILETELRASKVELQAANSSLEQLSAERESLKNLQESENRLRLQVETLQSQVLQIQEEHQSLVKEFEDKQTELSELYNEKDRISKELECCQFEKHEMATRLSSAQEEVALMRTGIEKLKVQMETDEKKKIHLVGKLKEREREADNLKDKIENLERELVLSEENLEGAILQTETTKEEAERLKSQKETLEMDLNTFRRKLVDLERELEKRQETIVELETTILNITNQNQLREESEKEIMRLQTQLNVLTEQKILSDETYEAAVAKQIDLLSLMEQNKAQLLQQLEEAHANIRSLELSVEKLTLKLEENHEELGKKTAHILILEGKMKEVEEMENKYSSELSQLHEEKVLSDEKYKDSVTKQADLLAVMDQNKAQFSQQLEEAQANSRNLEIYIEKLALELEENRLKLDEKTGQILVLEGKLKDAEHWENNYSADVLRFEVERESLKSEGENLKSMVDYLEIKVQTLSATNDSLQVTVDDLKTSCVDLEAQLESSAAEKNVLLQKVDELEENCTSLQRKLDETDLQMKTLQEQSSLERKALEGQIQAAKLQNEESNARLLSVMAEKSELKETVAQLHNELEAQAKISKDGLAEYQSRLLQADANQFQLDEIMKQHQGEIQGYQEKLSSIEVQLHAHRQEIDCLKARNGELNQCLLQAQQQLAELNQLKIEVAQLKEENSATCGKLNVWMESCKQLENEKEQLQIHLKEQEEALNNLQENVKSRSADYLDTSTDLLSEIEELKQSLEEKTLEADESVEKYCTLMIKSHKLEDANDMLKKQVELLSSKLKQFETNQEVQNTPPTVDNLVNASNKRSGKNRRSKQDTGKSCTKRRRDLEVTLDNEEQKPSTPQRLPKRIKKMPNSTGKQESVQENVEFVPDGLPEVVKKGFADIPSGKRSPFILRRTALPRRKSPRLSAQTQSPSSLSPHIDNLENLADFSSPTPGGSKTQPFKTPEPGQIGSGIGPMEVSSPLSACNRLKGLSLDSPLSSKLVKDGVCTSIKSLHEQSESEETCHVQ
ncbi:centromere protein F [Rhinophrynus dorsalis]